MYTHLPYAHTYMHLENLALSGRPDGRDQVGSERGAQHRKRGIHERPVLDRLLPLHAALLPRAQACAEI